MKYGLILSLLFVCFSTLMTPDLHAQGRADLVKQKLDQALKTHIVNLEPKNNCECNECRHSYTGDYKITKSQSVAGILRVYGVAKVKFKGMYTGGSGTVQFYAELENNDGAISVIKLKWRKGDCMTYETLLGGL